MEQQAKTEVNEMTRYLVVLETVISLAPLLGIYGTITGIIRAFGFLSAAGVPDPRLVAAGIAEALITTAAGLTIAIAAMPFDRHFLRRMEREAHEVEHHATTLELILAQRRRLDVEQTEAVLS
jgi:biopolymer transport protein ExbB